MLGATGAAEDFTVGFDAVADYPAIAVRADRRHGVDCTFETVECHCLSALRNLKGLIVIVAADITLGHQKLHHQRLGNTIAKVVPGSLCSRVTYRPSGSIAKRMDMLERIAAATAAILQHDIESELIAALPRQLVRRHAKRFDIATTEAPLLVRRDPIRAVTTKAALMDDGVAWLFDVLESMCQH